MDIKKITHDSPEFYSLLGPVFGSRKIQQETNDRFYDDEAKVWYIAEKAAVSLNGNTLKNFWADDGATAQKIIEFIQGDYKQIDGIVPAVYQPIFLAAGFEVFEWSKNFVKVGWLK